VWQQLAGCIISANWFSHYYKKEFTMEFESLENGLFTWESWAEEGPFSMQFGTVELTVPVGEFPAGTKFPNAIIRGDLSMLILVDDKQEGHAFSLALTVGGKVELPVDVHEGDACDCGHNH
jgi:hypothetical protein